MLIKRMPDPKGDEGAGGDPGKGTDDKTFTQAELDAAVTAGVSKATDPFKADADEYKRLAENPRFADFVTEENKRFTLGDEEYEKLYGDDKTGDPGEKGEPSLDDMNETERVDFLVKKGIQEETKSMREEIAQLSTDREKDAVDKEYKAVSSDKEKYPLFGKTIKVGDADTPVRELMAQELDKAAKAGRNMTIAQAYREVTYENQRELGRKDADDILAKKRDAASIGLPMSSPGQSTGEAPKKFKNPREAVEATLNELGM